MACWARILAHSGHIVGGACVSREPWQGCARLRVGVPGMCICSASIPPSALWRISTPTLGIKKKLLMSLVRLPWEPVANESLGLPFTFA